MSVGERLGRDHVAGEDLGQHVLVLGLQQVVDGAGRQSGEGFVGRGEHGERARARQRLDEAGSLDGGDERGVVGRVDGVLDDVLVLEHRGAADIRVRGISDAGESRHGEHGAGARRAESFMGDFLPLGDRYVPVDDGQATGGNSGQFRKMRSRKKISFERRSGGETCDRLQIVLRAAMRRGRQEAIEKRSRAPLPAGPLRATT